MKKYLKTPKEVINALYEGKEIRSGDYIYKMIDGLICYFKKGGWAVGVYINDIEKPYIEEAEPLKFEVGKFYKMRNGKKAMAGFIGNKSILFVSQEDGDTVWLNKNGKSDLGEYPWDIIGEGEK